MTIIDEKNLIDCLTATAEKCREIIAKCDCFECFHCSCSRGELSLALEILQAYEEGEQVKM